MPRVKESSWARNPIDRFILARLEQQRQKHAPEADRATLLRRLSFDLTGLPPSLEEQRSFLSDTLARRLRAAGRSAACEPAVRRAMGAALARPGAVCRDRRLRVRPGPARRLAISRLGRRGARTATCRTTVFVRLAARRRRGAARRSLGVHRHGIQSLLSRHGRPERPAAAPAECARRHHRDDRAGLPGADDRLRPLPRPQVRPDSADRLLPASGLFRRCAVPRRLPAGFVGRSGRSTRTPGPRGSASSAEVQSALIRLEAPCARSWRRELRRA